MKHAPPVAPPPVPAGATVTPVRPPLPSFGTGTEIWLARHAQVHEDYQKLAYGNRDVPLSAHGEQQTRDFWAAFEGVDAVRVQSSDLARARFLGEGVARSTGAELVLDARLREVDRGDWTLIPRTEFQDRWIESALEFHADQYGWKGHNGESDDDMFARIYPAFEEALHAAKGKRAFVTAHFNVVRILLSRLFGILPADSFHLPIQVGRAWLVRDGKDGWERVHENVNTPNG